MKKFILLPFFVGMVFENTRRMRPRYGLSIVLLLLGCSQTAEPTSEKGLGSLTTRSSAFRQLSVSTCPGNITSNITVDADITNASGDCFVPIAPDLTVDCQNHVIYFPAGGRLALMQYQKGLTIRNCRSNGGIKVFGLDPPTVDKQADQLTLLDSDLRYGLEDSDINGGGIQVIDGDDVTIRNSRLSGINLTLSDRSTVINNTIVGGGDHIVTFGADSFSNRCPSTGDPIPSDRTYHGVQFNHYFEGNVIVANEPNLGDLNSVIYFTCAAKSIFRNNVIRGLYNAQAIFLRDRSHSNYFESNVLWSDLNPRGTIFYGDGALDKSQPAANLWRYNFVRSDHSKNIRERNNTNGFNVFEYNIFWSLGRENFGGNPEISWGVISMPSDVTLVDMDPTDDLTLGSRAPGNVWRKNTFYAAATNEPAILMDGSMSIKDEFSSNLISHEGSNPLGGTYSSCPVGNTCVNRSTQSAAIFVNPSAGDFRPISSSAADGVGALLASNSSCTENWQCSPWSNYCTPDNMRMRSCLDLNHCHTEEHKPGFIESCDLPPSPSPTPLTNDGSTNDLNEASSLGVSSGCKIEKTETASGPLILFVTLLLQYFFQRAARPRLKSPG